MYLVKATAATNFPVVYDGPNISWDANQLRLVDDNLYARISAHSDVFTVVAGPDMGSVMQELANDQSADAPGAKNGATVAAAETAPVLHTTVLTCTATPITIADEAGQGQYGGVKVYDFPEGLICVVGAAVSGSLTAGVTGTIINNWDGDVGLGTAVVADHQDVAGLCGAVMQKNDVSAGASDKIGVVAAKTVAAALTESGARWIDGTATAADLFLNFLIDDDVSHTAGTAAFTGTITFMWLKVGDV